MSDRRSDNRLKGAPEREHEWQWSPRSGEGAASALGHLKRTERVKATWRRLRPSFVDEKEGGPSTS